MLTMKQKIAVIGAFTTIGQAVLDNLSEEGFLPKDIYVLDSDIKNTTKIPYNYTMISIQPVEGFKFEKVSIVFLCTPTLLKEQKDDILRYGTYLIDCVGILDTGICIIPSLNIKKIKTSQEIINPTALTVTLAQVLEPIHKAYKIQNVETTALLSADEFGKNAVTSLINQTRSFYTKEPPEDGPFKKIQAFNLIPEVFPPLSRQTMSQLKSLLHFPISVYACLTPIFQGECYSITISISNQCSLRQFKKIFSKNGYCKIIDHLNPYLTMTPQDVIHSDFIYLTHISIIAHRPNTFHLWIVCDSVRTGSAANAVQIAKHLLA